jgi:hypothetical protein
MIKKMIRKFARARTFILMLTGLDIETPWPSSTTHTTAVEYLHVDGLKILHREAEATSARPFDKNLAAARPSDHPAAREVALKQETGIRRADVAMARINARRDRIS